ncbi:Cation efflux system protein CusB precursor [Aliarcobacter thereius]|uniref:Cation efflux system protein CusB n=1 Tax=Aliarcobacter thereius TaxID=544718 RepID=A0A1C0BA01_9BACT|nr:efflux RND transporter periplasmic adaptor subunit [Aliarcobacter thereius]OCL91935.1 Cation efflux system protein CusB precursor [Aliarcobacter thereius]OCM00415.1 Cation efflux system protein CusB precursor [Aliarcobacter thereius]TLS72617.1 HlyD family efflux transporter periplasmic adaptor subunit [Aliarcobacter thereius]HJE02648.1 efflux RND transporter periplasmic adaptor subunit [Aliarcobacter thereius]
MKKILLILFLLLQYNFAEILDAKQLFNIEKIKAKEKKITQSKSFYGLTKIDESKVVDIVSRFDGYITYLNTNKNYMDIKKGELLYKIYSPEISSSIAELEIAKEINKDIENKVSGKLINLNIDKNEQERLIKSNNKDVFVKSNIDGIITQKNVNNQSFIEKGKTIFQISQIDSLWFIASVYQEDLSFIKTNMKANIKLDGLENPINAKVDFIYPVIDDSKKTVDIRFIIDNKSRNILPSMFGKVELIKEEREVLSLPRSAVIKRADEYFVFIPKSNGDFEPKKIEAKRVSKELYEVYSGISKDDEVINNSLFLYDADAMTNRLYDVNDEEW